MKVVGLMMVAAALSAQYGVAHATLVPKNLDSNPATAEAYYDPGRSLTWIADWGMAAGTAWDDGASTTDGKLSWGAANGWAASLTLGGVTGWQLPSDGWLSTCGHYCTTGASDWTHLWYTELGNSPGVFSNAGSFIGVSTTDDVYWGASDFVSHGGFLSYTTWYIGDDAKWKQHFAVAVHTGEIGSPVIAVPEPQTTELLFAGLAVVVALARRRRPR